MLLDTTFLTKMTRNHFEPALQNQIYNKFVLWNRLQASARIKTLTGPALYWNIVAAKHKAFGLLSGYEVMANQQINPVQQATLNPAFYYATVGISKEEEIKNSGSMEKLLDMVTTQFDNARTTLSEQMQTDAYGSGTAVGGKYPIDGLGDIISSGRIYANVNSSTYTFWDANVNSTEHTFINLQDPTTTSYMPRIMRKAYTDATHDDAPTLIITSKGGYNLYSDIAGEKLRTHQELADLGFGGAQFGTVPMVFDDYVPVGDSGTTASTRMYFMTLSDYALWVYAGMNFNTDGWQQPTDQAAKLTHIFWMGQLQCTSPRQQSSITYIHLS
jgi:hypothetical protein